MVHSSGTPASGASDMDETDRKILKQLQMDGRLTVTELSERIALSATPCARRLKRLEDEGVITGYRAMIDRNLVRLSTTVFVGVSLAEHSADAVGHFERTINDMPEIISCYVVSGEYDYLLEVVSADIQDHERFLRRLLSEAAVKSLHSCFAMRTVKSGTTLPIA